MTSTPQSTIRILIVEDDEDDYVLTADLLRQADAFRFDIEWAAEPLVARNLFSENRHDLCLMDYRLGIEVGVNLVRNALQLGFTAPIIMLSGQEDTGVEIEAAAAGAVDYLAKNNLGSEQLLRAIRYALARSEIQAERFERVRAETENRSKSEFLAVLSHEIRTPLTAIIGYTELLIHRHRQVDSDLARKLQIIRRNGDHLLNLLNDTLDLSKIEAGKFEIDITRFELGPFMMNVLGLVRAMADAKHLTLQLTPAQPLPRYIHSDEMRLRQILLNLLANAIKFTETGSVEVQIELKGTLLAFHVLDTGKGISSANLDAIFSPFTQLTPGQTPGTGLGLTISRKLAEKLGGSISAHSREGKGSRFTVLVDPGSISFNEAADFSHSADNRQVAIRSAMTMQGSVLVVDDVDDIRELISAILSEAGIEVVTASNGCEALARLACEDKGIALVLLDLNMPGMDGFRTLQQLRAAGHQLPVVALTAANMKGDQEKCLAAGFSGYLPKPVTTEVLLDALEKQLQLLQAQAPLLPAGTHVLVIEDNRDANSAICMLLQLSGCEVSAAHDRGEALKLFSNSRPTVVLADLHLGDSDGAELLQELHREAPTVRYFILSGDSSGRSSTLPAFIEGYIGKPVNLAALTRALATKVSKVSE